LGSKRLGGSDHPDENWLTHRGEQPRLFFWRSAAGREVDVLVDAGQGLVPVEVKSARTVADDSLDGLRYWRDLKGEPDGPAALVYGGDQAMKRSGVCVYPWFAL
jgi:hypothetical protein